MNKKRKLVISHDIPPPDPSGGRHLPSSHDHFALDPDPNGTVLHHDFTLPLPRPSIHPQDFVPPVIHHPQDFRIEGGAVEEDEGETVRVLPAVEGSDTESEEEEEDDEESTAAVSRTNSQKPLSRDRGHNNGNSDTPSQPVAASTAVAAAGSESVRLPGIKDLMKSSSGGDYEAEPCPVNKSNSKFQNGGYLLDYRNHPYGAAAAAAAAFHPYGVIVDSFTRVSMAAAAAGSGFHPVLPLYAQRRNGLFPGHISHSVPGLGYHPSAMALNPRANYDYKEEIITNNFKRKHDSVDSTLSNKRGKKHDSTPVEEYVNWAIKLNNYNMTGIAYRPSKFIILNEDKFYEWVRSIKAPEYALSKSSLLEKFDKSRRTNRVNPKENFGRIPIKFLRIDKVSRNAPSLTNLSEIEKDLEEIQRQYGANHIRVITHRDWGYIDPEHFFYEVPNKKS